MRSSWSGGSENKTEYGPESGIPEDASLKVEEILSEEASYEEHLEETKKALKEDAPTEAAEEMDLLPLIGIVADDPDTRKNELDEFAENIADVKFSDESLLKVGHPEKDVTLKELKDELGIDGTVLSAAYAAEEAEQPDITPVMGEGAYYIDESAGDTDGLSFSAPDAGIPAGPGTREQEDAEPADGGDTVRTDASDSDALNLTVIKDEDTIKAGTWVLISIQPFTSEETLTITMVNGDQYIVKVTDQLGDRWEVYFDGTLGQSSQRTASRRFYNGASNARSTAAKGETITIPGVGDWVRWDQWRTYEVTAPNATGYSYKLNGWYMINPSTGEKNYYKPGDKATINHDTIFYADWVPSTYSKGSSAGTINTPSAAGFVKTELFDYNELIKWDQLSSFL